MDKAFVLLRKWLTRETLLLLSGGSSPKSLYQKLASSNFSVGAVATADERFGPFGHKESNEKMIEETGIYEWAEKQNAEIYRVLHKGESVTLEEAAKNYEKRIAEALQKFPKKVAIMGIGADGHTAGIAPGVDWWDTDKLVVGYRHDPPAGGPGWHWPERITLTFAALRKIDNFIVLLFGEEKRKILLRNFPASFYLEVASRTTVVLK